MKKRKAFLDTNILTQIIGEKKQGEYIYTILKENNFEIVTFRKCIYELYSIVKGTTKDGCSKKNNPLSDFLHPDLNDISQKLFRNYKDIDSKGNTFFWFNTVEEFKHNNSFQNSEEYLSLIHPSERDDAKEFIKRQELFIEWKEKILNSIYRIDQAINQKGITICEYFQVYTSEWYHKEGFFLEQELSKNSLLPNEDFEIILSALFLGAEVLITNETSDNGIIWRGGLSFGFNSPRISFCCPERIEEAIKDNFILRIYQKKSR